MHWSECEEPTNTSSSRFFIWMWTSSKNVVLTTTFAEINSTKTHICIWRLVRGWGTSNKYEIQLQRLWTRFHWDNIQDGSHVYQAGGGQSVRNQRTPSADWVDFIRIELTWVKLSWFEFTHMYTRRVGHAGQSVRNQRTPSAVGRKLRHGAHVTLSKTSVRVVINVKTDKAEICIRLRRKKLCGLILSALFHYHLSVSTRG